MIHFVIDLYVAKEGVGILNTLLPHGTILFHRTNVRSRTLIRIKKTTGYWVDGNFLRHVE